MRISFVVPGLTLSGGMLSVIEIANALSRRGHDVVLVSPRVMDESRHLLDDTVRVTWTRSGLVPLPNRHLTNAIIALEMAALTPPSDFLVATYAPTAIPVLFAAHLGRGQPYWWYADYEEMFEARPVEARILRHLPRYFRRILANSGPAAEDIHTLSGAQAVRVGIGLPTRHNFGPPTSETDRAQVAMYVGDSRPRKGLDDFLAAAEIARHSLPELRLVVVTKDEPSIQSSIPYQHVVRPSGQTLGDLYRSCGVFASTSWYESLGLPAIEAMACGAPVIVTDQRGARDFAVDGENALVVPVQSPHAVAAAMIRILRNPELARALSRSGLATAARYRWEQTTDRFEAALGIAPMASGVA